MKSAPLPLAEAERLQALQDFQVLDSQPEQAFDDIVAVAAELCGTPIALVSLVDDDRQWFKAKVGIDAAETPRDIAFCSHAILQNDAFVVADTAEDPRFADNPLVTADPYIRFYAGAPLIVAEGQSLGTLCVIDRKPRDLDPATIAALEALARTVVAQLELRRMTRVLANALDRTRLLGELLPMCAWCRRIRDDDQYWHRVEAYLESHTGTEISHGICPDCMTKHYPGARRESRDERP